MQYGYDGNGNRKSLIDHRNQRTDYRYDGINRLDEIVIPGLGTIDYDYHPDARLKAVIFPNGSQSSYSYDRADRIDTISHSQSGEEVAFYDYDHDSNGNRSRQEVRNGQGTEITTYNYDRADRLDGVFYPDRTVAYSLDPVGNRTLETATPTPGSAFPGYIRNYDYNTRDQLTQVDDDQGLLITYQYDENGNQIEKTENGLSTTFGYSPRDRMTTVTPQGEPSIQYSYDYRGLRQEKQANGNTTRYVYDEQSLLAETNTLGNTVARYHYGSDRRLAETRGTQNAYFMIDALGTPIAITTQEGTIQTRYTYDAWGNLDRKEGESPQPFGFTGYIADPETGLYYAQQRYYDSFTGRFLREDPFAGDIQTPPSLHRYIYAHVNPTVFIDPTGQFAEAGHYYTTLIVAEDLGFSAEEAEILAAFSQLPDEADRLDAFETQKGALGESFANVFRPRILEQTNNQRLRDQIHSSLHALSGDLAEVQTDRTVRAIEKVGDDLKAVGILIHRLGDTFAHRVTGNEEYLYDTGAGHGKDFSNPDTIQRRRGVYMQYAETLVGVLARVKGINDPEELERAQARILKKLDPIVNIETREPKSITRRGVTYFPTRSNKHLEALSIKEAHKILESINKDRISRGDQPITLMYMPEKRSLSHFTPGAFVSVEEALEAINDSNSNLGIQLQDIDEALQRVDSALKRTKLRSLADSQEANKALVIGEGDENQAEIEVMVIHFLDQ